MDTPEDLKQDVEDRIANDNAREIGLPVCPHCKADPLNIQARPIQLGALNFIAVFCGNPKCRKVFNVQLLAMPGQQQPQRSAIIPGNVHPAFAKH